jgi:hypothetical protein
MKASTLISLIIAYYFIVIFSCFFDATELPTPRALYLETYLPFFRLFIAIFDTF